MVIFNLKKKQTPVHFSKKAFSKPPGLFEKESALNFFDVLEFANVARRCIFIFQPTLDIKRDVGFFCFF